MPNHIASIEPIGDAFKRLVNDMQSFPTPLQLALLVLPDFLFLCVAIVPISILIYRAQRVRKSLVLSPDRRVGRVASADARQDYDGYD